MTTIIALISRFRGLIPYWRIILLALAVLTAAYTGWHARGVVEQAKMAEELQAMAEKRRKQEEDANRVAAELEGKLAALNEKARQLNRRIARETTKPEYSCPVPADGVRLLREAVDAANSR